MQRVNYLIKKMQQKILHTLFAETAQFMRALQGGSNHDNLKKIGFYLDNNLFIHLGDQLFFEPALRLISTKHEACIKPTHAMKEYFMNSGAWVINDDGIFDCDAIVTRDELLPEVIIKTKAVIISINTLSENMQHRISEAIARILAEFFKIEIPRNFKFTPWKPAAQNPRTTADKVILAPYVDSGWFRVWDSDVNQLSSNAKKYADQYGFLLCLVGGNNDTAAKIPTGIKPLFEDWRGRYSPCQFMQILSSGQIAMVFTFDTFVFHAAVACGVPVTVKIRRRMQKKTLFIEEHFLPAYSSPNHQINFL